MLCELNPAGAAEDECGLGPLWHPSLFEEGATIPVLLDQDEVYLEGGEAAWLPVCTRSAACPAGLWLGSHAFSK
eukprot:7144957-Alexandrium_andersonii.AAC.1